MEDRALREDGELVVAHRRPGVARPPGARPGEAARRRVRRGADRDRSSTSASTAGSTSPRTSASSTACSRTSRSALHARGIRFLDHYSCNVVARPRSREELELYHAGQRHHVAIHPDAFSAPSAGYDGFRFDDLREIDVGTGEPGILDLLPGGALLPQQPRLPRDAPALPPAPARGSTARRRHGRRHVRLRVVPGAAAASTAGAGSARSTAASCRRSTTPASGGTPRGTPPGGANYGNPAFRDWVTAALPGPRPTTSPW